MINTKYDDIRITTPTVNAYRVYSVMPSFKFDYKLRKPDLCYDEIHITLYLQVLFVCQ